ncbi:isocitrate dehydrogenase [Agrilactobacillus composti DSM 18527 = JCM 14202]|uniref:NADP-dependent isocitrate dehydrogenase n=1 Tax=Agrilactobacillus composti TaxID=398555 RepID=UPI00042E08F0|nr:NADP-dependent isocitrate dehydrogenase [Agrilactobacillus composti]GAF41378.1 isocitrate dehydrogenase [Agrilactobacillus composti DSM 18527 = JCM 14202]
MTKDFITHTPAGFKVPDHPIIPYIEGDGIGPEVWAAAQPVFNTAVHKVFGTAKRVEWQEVLAGEKAFNQTGEWLPQATKDALQQALIGIKGPLTTPIGKGHRSINVTLRQYFDLYACVRPVQYFKGTPSPVKKPELVDMVIFRENTEDIYAGIEYAQKNAAELKQTLIDTNQMAKVRFPDSSNYAIKPISKEGSERFVISAIDYALAHKRHTLTLVHKGNIMKLTEGAFKQWGYDIAEAKYGDQVFTWQQYTTIKANDGAAAAEKAFKAAKQAQKLIINDIITDNFFQQALINPQNFEIVATCNLNGDYMSDALSAQVGGIGIAPSGNINYTTGQAIFESTHGTAPEFVGQNKLNPSSILLSGAMMFDYFGWRDVGNLITEAIATAIQNKQVTWDFAAGIPGATQLSTSDFGAYLQRLIEAKA